MALCQRKRKSLKSTKFQGFLFWVSTFGLAGFVFKLHVDLKLFVNATQSFSSSITALGVSKVSELCGFLLPPNG